MNTSPLTLLRRAILATVALLTASLGSRADEARNPSGFIIHRGINISHWLSQDFGWQPRAVMFSENDARYLASIGFDHVRLPIDEKEMWAEDGSPNEQAFALLETALQWCAKHDLRAIVDLHTLRSHHFNAANEGQENTLWTDPAAQEGFFDLWSQISQRLAHHPVDQVAYEIMNEPVAPTHDDWNRLVANALARIRANEPDRVVVIGSNLWQIPETLGAIEIPEGDKNIILSTHTYSPLAFTHYLAEWTPLKDYTGPIQYPGVTIPEKELKELLAVNNGSLKDLVGDSGLNWGPDQFRKKFAPAVNRAKELGLQLYCGEFGCLPTVPRDQRLQYYKDITDAMEDLGMAWANWEFRGDFGIFEWHREETVWGSPDIDLIEILVGNR